MAVAVNCGDDEMLHVFPQDGNDNGWQGLKNIPQEVSLYVLYWERNGNKFHLTFHDAHKLSKKLDQVSCDKNATEITSSFIKMKKGKVNLHSPNQV